VNQTTIAANPEGGGSPLRRVATAAASYAPTMLNAGWIALAAAMLGLGMLGFITGDFALNWQPVPAWVPARTTLAYVTAAVFWTLGAGLLVDRYKQTFAIATAVAFFVWAVLLHGPGVVRDPLFARWSVLAARIAFGVSLPIFGLSHWAYAQFTADMIPAFIPAHLFWAYFTGAGHIAAGVAILTGVFAHLGAILFAVMVSGFVLLLHVPRVIGDPGSRNEWTMLVIALTITAAAWCAAGSLWHTETCSPSTSGRSDLPRAT
jgi:uncharacterized membrane protein YphA (DoxX/SURF4 family)